MEAIKKSAVQDTGKDQDVQGQGDSKLQTEQASEEVESLEEEPATEQETDPGIGG